MCYDRNMTNIFQDVEKKLELMASSRQYFADENDRFFAARMYKSGIETYTSKLQALSFDDFESVLDAGCGFGQWLLSLSLMNKKVVGIDLSQERVNFVNEMLSNLEITNATVVQGSIMSTKFSSNSFSGIFSYGTVFCTPWKKTLEEFYRILAPNGLIYFNIATIDWYIFLWKTEHNKVTDYNPRRIAAEALMNSTNYTENQQDFSGQIVMDVDETRNFLRHLGFVDIEIHREGNLDGRENLEKTRDIWRQNGERGLFEITARKRG